MREVAIQRGVARQPGHVVSLVAALPPGARWLGILTGGRGAGKTTWCAALVTQARARGLTVGGLLSPALFADDASESGVDRTKTRIDLLDLASGERRVLATPGDAATEGHGMRWHFHPEATAWGNGVLEASGGVDLLIVDELGPLEFAHGRGLTAGLAQLDARTYRAAVVVIRPELLETAAARWPEAEVIAVPEWGADGTDGRTGAGTE